MIFSQHLGSTHLPEGLNSLKHLYVFTIITSVIIQIVPLFMLSPICVDMVALNGRLMSISFKSIASCIGRPFKNIFTQAYVNMVSWGGHLMQLGFKFYRIVSAGGHSTWRSHKHVWTWSHCVVAHNFLGLVVVIILFYSILDTMGEISWFTYIFSFFFPTMSVFVDRPNSSQICLRCTRFSWYVGKHLNCVWWGLFKVDNRFCIRSLSPAHTTMTSNVPNRFSSIRLMLSNANISCKD
jgi:hypothetical protein